MDAFDEESIRAALPPVRVTGRVFRHKAWPVGTWLLAANVLGLAMVAVGWISG